MEGGAVDPFGAGFLTTKAQRTPRELRIKIYELRIKPMSGHCWGISVLIFVTRLQFILSLILMLNVTTWKSFVCLYPDKSRRF